MSMFQTRQHKLSIARGVLDIWADQATQDRRRASALRFYIAIHKKLTWAILQTQTKDEYMLAYQDEVRRFHGRV